MIGHLYRYPHPHDPARFIYVGQGPDRDHRHRNGAVGFGRRFKKLFPGIELPQPIREQAEVENHLELNELETIWMFRYHTWRGYPDGMNLIFPGSTDYKNMGKLGGPIGGKIGGPAAFKLRVGVHGRTPEQMREDSRKAGKLIVERKRGIHGRTAEQAFLDSQKGGNKNVQSGQVRELGYRQGPIQGRKNVESGLLARICSDGGKIGGAVNSESGQIQKLGREQGRKNVDSGWWNEIRKLGASAGGKAGSATNHAIKNEEGKSIFAMRMGKKSVHSRLHVKSGLIDPSCEFCQ